MSYSPGCSGIYGGIAEDAIPVPTFPEINAYIKNGDNEAAYKALVNAFYRTLIATNKAEAQNYFKKIKAYLTYRAPGIITVFNREIGRNTKTIKRGETAAAEEANKALRKQMRLDRINMLKRINHIPKVSDYYNMVENGMDDFDFASEFATVGQHKRKYDYTPEILAMPKGKERNQAMAQWRRNFEHEQEYAKLGADDIALIERLKPSMTTPKKEWIDYTVHRQNKPHKIADKSWRADPAYERRKELLHLTGRGFDEYGSGFY